MSDIETLLRNAAKSGRLNHLSIASTWDGQWEVSYRGVSDADRRIVRNKDVVAAFREGLGSRAVPVKRPPKEDEDILV